jgi:hypothetical protein
MLRVFGPPEDRVRDIFNGAQSSTQDRKVQTLCAFSSPPSADVTSKPDAQAAPASHLTSVLIDM